jgi:hypothetical protein
VAVAHARSRFGDRPNVHYLDRSVTAEDLAQVKPTKVVMAGLLHHLDDATAIELLRMCARTESVRRIATHDVVYLPGQTFSNRLARFDRGKSVRNVPAYRVLVQEAGWRVSEEKVVKTHPTSGRALLLLMGLERA